MSYWKNGLLLIAVLESVFEQANTNGMNELLLSEITSFVLDNGYKFVSVISNGFPNYETNLTLKLQAETDIRTRVVDNDTFREHFNFELDFMIIWEDMLDEDRLPQTLELLTQIKIKFALLVVPILDEARKRFFHQSMTKLMKNAYFYLVCLKASAGDGPKAVFKYIISLNFQPQYVENDVMFHSNSRLVWESFNLQGLSIRSVALSWSPYLNLKDCDQQGDNCSSSGFLVDYANLIGRLFNFTVVSTQDKDLNWGVVPISGPFNSSGTWGGTMGDVINGKFDLSLSQWIWNIERQDLLDFVITSSNWLQLALTPQLPEVDTGLFLRPFTYDAWMAILAITGVVIVAVLAPYLIFYYYEYTTGYMITSTTGWYFFVLVNAFYGGALTMFFTSEITIPFRTIRDVMQAYPDYKLLMMDGNDVHFQYKALQGDPDYATFWNRVVNQRAETVVGSLEEGLQKIQSERAVLHVFAGMLRGYFQDNPFHQQNLKIFAQQKPQFQSIIFPSNSPLRAVFQSGSLILRENGAEEKLLAQWEGPEVSSSGGVDKMVLEPGQVILVYIIMGGALLVSFITLGIEVLWKGVQNGNPPRGMKKGHGLHHGPTLIKKAFANT
ncbi:hypothetical protein TCAL_05368 [Tigriopus californicus]|uniref:Ionotropic glutamate receptor L-glutamate and glycine-binding domain-containing protein n=1 Tax=Tigriopus californicus TaxID=6832 RepID=A0A553NQ78_TIGCA|nr:uncharacterized protein LOC131879131 [Tigriopus californicus]TRY67601.1 hypothetical protein TCAL_05368 [Tigriopus californicus]|eukprot:TCALIF_05368-PA protein Name:"Protein of unknown function" AED:0.40 eAED:0.40 QI:0/0.5/0/0.66/1/1/3/0/609